MAFKLVPRGWETSLTTGTGAFTLAGAVTNYRALSADLANGDTTWYFIVNRSAYTQWEEGLGTWGTGGILTRTTVIRSSNANAAVNFSAGIKEVMCTCITAGAVPGGAATGQVLLGTTGGAPTWSGPDLTFTSPVLTVGGSTAGAGIVLTGSTITANAPLITGTSTWNNAAVTFIGNDFTITDTASAAASLALRIRGGASGTTTVFTVGKTGTTNFGTAVEILLSDGTYGGTRYRNLLSNENIIFGIANLSHSAFGIDGATGNVRARSASLFAWSTSGDAMGGGSVIDTGLARNGAGVVETNNGTKGTIGTIRSQYQSSDGTAGETFAATATVTLTVKNGLIVAHT